MRKLYDELYDPLFQYIFYLTNNRVLAEEFVQDAFVKLFEKEQVEQPKAYLYRIARNLIYDYYRRKRLISWLPLGKEDRASDNFPQDLLEQNEMNRRLYEALSHIKIHYRETIILRYIEELSVRETAELLGISEVKVKNNTARGLRELRKLLGGEFDGAIKKSEAENA